MQIMYWRNPSHSSLPNWPHHYSPSKSIP